MLALAELQVENFATKLVWIMHKKSVEEAYGGEEKDALAAHGTLGVHIHGLNMQFLREVIMDIGRD
ncbi:hypothetical protein [Lysinibacillus sp. G01H]|uniref:hypothetical protein n=1 Tax=Lysinibacillus sp. G01H TaxID=3026425 RepID=UPI00406CD2BB